VGGLKGVRENGDKWLPGPLSGKAYAALKTIGVSA
jgi:hypothetical protein